MDTENIVVSIFWFVCIVGVGALLYAEIAPNYNVPSQTGSFTKVQNATVNLNKLQSDMVTQLTKNGGSGNIVYDMMIGANLAWKLLLSTIDTIGKLLGVLVLEMGGFLGYPVILASIIAIIGFSFIIALILLIAKIIK
jgi:hypothetical protein